MGTISIERTESFEAGADRLWQILADEFTDVASWASSIDHSKANADAMVRIDGAPAGGRVCEIPGVGVTDERFIRFDVENKSFAYSVNGGKMPGFVQDLQSAWSVEAMGPQQARVTFTVSANATASERPQRPPRRQPKARHRLSIPSMPPRTPEDSTRPASRNAPTVRPRRSCRRPA